MVRYGINSIELLYPDGFKTSKPPIKRRSNE